MIRNFTSQIAQRELGVNWADRFVQRHPDQLISKWTMGIDNSHHKANSEGKYNLYFDLLRKKIEHYRIEPRYMYNMNEKSCQIKCSILRG
jgi:hypothetical protein